MTNDSTYTKVSDSMPMPEKNVSTPKPVSTAKEETFVPFDEEASSAAEANSAVVIDVPSVPITYDYVPTSDDLSMPRILLLQGNAEIVLQGGAKAGEWLLPGGETAQEFTVGVLGMRRSRIRSIKGAGDEKPTMLCTSPDAVQGYGNPGILCRECPHAQWGPKDPKTGKGTPPDCRLRYHYLVETEQGERAELTVNTTTKASKQASQAITEGIARWGNEGAFSITMGRKLQESNGNRYFVPVVKSVNRNAAEEVDVLDI